MIDPKRIALMDDDLLARAISWHESWCSTHRGDQRMRRELEQLTSERDRREAR